MVEILKYSNISKIYVKDLIFYDEQREPELKQMCNEYGISYIPAKDKTHIYKFNGEAFEKIQLTEDLCCNPYDLLFTQETIGKFESGNHDEVLFVTENDIIQGVVHIVDYNNEFIYFETYKLMFQFEKNLRSLLEESGYKNEDFINWIREKADTNRHYERRFKALCPKNETKYQEELRKRRDCGPFQTFYLLEILHFACDQSILSSGIYKARWKIGEIRNWVAHAKDVTGKRRSLEGEDLEGPLYKMEELKSFVNGLNNFFRSYEEVENKLKLKTC